MTTSNRDLFQHRVTVATHAPETHQFWADLRSSNGRRLAEEMEGKL
jgi:hypothetical protein